MNVRIKKTTKFNLPGFGKRCISSILPQPEIEIRSTTDSSTNSQRIV